MRKRSRLGGGARQGSIPQTALQARLENHVLAQWRDRCRQVVVRFRGRPACVKAFPLLVSLKYSAAQRWVAAVNAEGSWGRLAYRMARTPADVPEVARSAAEELSGA